MAEPPFHVGRAATPRDLAAARSLRHQVFVVEQRVPEDIEQDEWDDAAWHAIALDDQGEAVGTGRLVVRRGVAAVGRMAVRADWRGRGVGELLLATLEQAARESGCRVVELHAQEHATGFYRRAGYVAVGDAFHEAGIPHVAMRKPV